MLGTVEEVFNPAHVHVVEQRETEERLVDVASDAGPAEPGAGQRRRRHDR